MEPISPLRNACLKHVKNVIGFWKVFVWWPITSTWSCVLHKGTWFTAWSGCNRLLPTAYHKFRKVHGKLFQGRYKSLIVEEETYLGALQHYVYLNPVRAKMCSGAELKNYRWSSYWYLHRPRKQPAFLDISGALQHAGGLKDTRERCSKYSEYLEWLSTDEPTRKEMAFDKMCR